MGFNVYKYDGAGKVDRHIVVTYTDADNNVEVIARYDSPGDMTWNNPGDFLTTVVMATVDKTINGLFD